MRLVHDNSVFQLYGQWNALVALNERKKVLGVIRAHDGDFFPESVMDYVDAIRAHGVDNPGEGDAPYPIRVDIDITQACNAMCTFCFSRPYQRPGYRGQFVSANLLRDVIYDLGSRRTKSIRFCGGGDPMVHPEIEAILPLAHEADMRLCVISNLDFIDSAMSDLILDSVDHVRWSVNAATDETRIAVHRPGKKANPLHVSMDRIRKLVCKRRDRKPLIWATFLVLPANFREMSEAARLLRDVGVDSVSFRPVFHGLGGSWTKDELAELPKLFDDLGTLDRRPEFSVFLPKRNLEKSAALDPSIYFSECHSRRVRTVLEATSAGLTCQSCGMYRGTGSAGRMSINETNSFRSVWQKVHFGCAYPPAAPQMCKQCIDVSMNVTLEAVASIFDIDRRAKFYRAHLDQKELTDIGPTAWLGESGDLPHWIRTCADQIPAR